MSRALKTNQVKPSIDGYLASWKTTGKLLREGHSFSGRERNCAFLNCRSPQFANVSAITGLDFPDDGRGLAAVDWDHDGDLDLWFLNRTGPRLRLMCNQTNAGDRISEKGFIALRLQGTHSNRDAIGARVEVVLKEGDSDLGGPNSELLTHQPLIQTLCAGDAYLSQSSKWLHFGLGSHGVIDHVTVRWPRGKVEHFTDMSEKNRYLLVEGSGKAEVVDVSKRSTKLTVSVQDVPKTTVASRIQFFNRLPMPILRPKGYDGTTLPAIKTNKRPLLINLWASWCVACIGELQELTNHQDQLREVGLDILVLAVDGLGSDGRGNPDAVQQILEKIDFPFAASVATGEILDKLLLVQSVVLNQSPDFGVPISFLLDGKGRLAAIYRGPVSFEKLRDDISQLDSSPEQRRDLAIPFSGRWNTAPRNLLLQSVANVFKEGGHLEDYERYAKMDIVLKDQARQMASSPEERKRIDQQVGDMQFNLARTLQADGQTEKAIQHYKQGLTVKPDDALAHYFLGQILLSNRQVEAVEHFQHALRTNPQLVAARIQLGKVLRIQGATDEAIEQFRRVLMEYPESVEAHFNLGVMLTSQGDLEKGIRHLQQTVQLKPKNLQALMKLGDVLGNNGDFDGAADAFSRVVAIQPNIPRAHSRLAQALGELGKPVEAAAHLEKAILLKPTDQESMLQLAWLRATSLVEGLRDGVQAVELAERVSKATNSIDPRILDTLAAAYAEAGEFEAAVRVAAQALANLDPNQEIQANEISERLELYQQGQPYRDAHQEHLAPTP